MVLIQKLTYNLKYTFKLVTFPWEKLVKTIYINKIKKKKK